VKAMIRGIAHLAFAMPLLAALTIFTFGQTRDRILDWHPLPPVPVDNRLNGQPTSLEPLELVEITVEGRPVICGQPFIAGTDWLKSLTLKIRNVSTQPIKFIRISFYVPEAKFKDSFLGFSLEYGRETSDGVSLSYGTERLMPGTETELARSADAYYRYRDTVAKGGVNTDFTKAFIGLTYLRFEDGTVWDGLRLKIAAKAP